MHFFIFVPLFFKKFLNIQMFKHSEMFTPIFKFSNSPLKRTRKAGLCSLLLVKKSVVIILRFVAVILKIRLVERNWSFNFTYANFQFLCNELLKICAMGMVAKYFRYHVMVLYGFIYPAWYRMTCFLLKMMCIWIRINVLNYGNNSNKLYYLGSYFFLSLKGFRILPVTTHVRTIIIIYIIYSLCYVFL